MSSSFPRWYFHYSCIKKNWIHLIQRKEKQLWINAMGVFVSFCLNIHSRASCLLDKQQWVTVCCYRSLQKRLEVSYPANCRAHCGSTQYLQWQIFIPFSTLYEMWLSVCRAAESVPPKPVKSERLGSVIYSASQKKGQERFTTLSGKYLLINLSNTTA